MKSSDKEKEYYAITLTANDSGRIQVANYSVWVGFTDEMREIRKPDTVRRTYSSYWEKEGQPYIIVEDEGQLLIWFISGGNALVEMGIAKAQCGWLLKEDIVVDANPSLGFISLRDVSSTVVVRAPSKKQRMRIIKRDNYKCRICGRSPDNYTDVELHVHHIRPHSLGGLTTDWNLITLCHTCHDGLDPHHEACLYGLIGSFKNVPDGVALNQEHERGVHNYRKWLKKD